MGLYLGHESTASPLRFIICHCNISTGCRAEAKSSDGSAPQNHRKLGGARHRTALDLKILFRLLLSMVQVPGFAHAQQNDRCLPAHYRTIESDKRLCKQGCGAFVLALARVTVCCWSKPLASLTRFCAVRRFSITWSLSFNRDTYYSQSQNLSCTFV